jgi:RNA polymerase sigma factor (sigma-70 family)
MKPAENQLIARAASGDREAFSALVKNYYGMIYKVAYQWCGNRTDAEDITQEVCVKLAKSIAGFRGESAFSSWLYRITLNTVHDMWRRGSRHTDSQEELENQVDGAASPESTAMTQQLWLRVRKLPATQRDCILLVYGQDLSHAEAAKIMDCPEGTVSWHIHEAKKQLQEWLI